MDAGKAAAMALLNQVNRQVDNLTHSKDRRFARKNSWSKWILTGLFAIMLLIGAAEIALLVRTDEFLRNRARSIPSETGRAIFVGLIVAAWTTLSSLIYLITRFAFKERIVFAALAVLYAVTTLVASVVAVIFFEIGLGRLPIEGCARRRRWGTVCTELEIIRALAWALIIVSSFALLVAFARLVLGISEWLRAKAERAVLKKAISAGTFLTSRAA